MRPLLLALFACLLLGCEARGSDDDDAIDDGVRRCNGSEALCDRPFPDVVLPSTHNAMSNRAEGWLAPNQNVGIEAQLDDGIRGMLLDTYEHEGVPYLCHSSCAFGSRPLLDALQGIDAFLRSNPNEVLAIIFQDAITPERTAEVFEESGLIDHVYTHEGTWPTLGAMIDAGTRLVVTAESAGPPPAWYAHAWDLFTDTNYSFSSVDAFECSPNRGEPDHDLFLLNHWIGNPLPNEDASRAANAGRVLHERVAQCEQERGRLPTLFAVDHHDVGDLMEVVAELNAR